jgi:hypothetical protein
MGAEYRVYELHKTWGVNPWICGSDIIDKGVWVGPNLHRWLMYEWSGAALRTVARRRVVAKLASETPYGLPPIVR